MSEPPVAGRSPLERAVEVMDRLRSPGGCPWDAAQTHDTLTRYLVEECYEVLEAIETGDGVLLREELGDLLLQVLFHARLTQERPGDDAFGIDEVAGDLADNLVRRHPHVFGTDAERGSGAVDADSLDTAWEAQKIAEKGRTSALDGVPLAQPALALSAKLVSRAERAGIAAEPVSDSASTDLETEIGMALFATVRAAVAAGVDPEGALRRVAGRYRQAIREDEARKTRPVARGGLPDGYGESNSR